MNKQFFVISLLLMGCGNQELSRVPGGCAATPVEGGVMIRCPNGPTSFLPNGATGAIGPTGPAGAKGDKGDEGADGTVITVKQLCPSTFTPVYPSVFPEVGLCIDDKLYGVYSANGGFLVYMPPGSYYSNGIGATCTLKVRAHCEVE